MKKYIGIMILTMTLTIFILPLKAQVAINTDNSVPDGSAMLDVKSTTKGMLVPRMTTVQRDAIASPANGLMVFCTDNNQFYYNKGTPAAKNWVMVNSQWMANGSNIYFNEGNVGIGTSAPNAPLQFSNTAANRKIVLWETLNNDHNFYGFGINSSILRYQVDATTASHIFYAGTSPTSSAELLRIQGDGKVGIGMSAPIYKLDIGNADLGSNAGNTVLWERLWGTSLILTDQLNIYHRRYTAGSDWTTAEIRIQHTIDNTDMQYISFKGGNSSTVGSLVFGYQNSEHMVFENDGNIGIGTSNPEESAALEISSTTRGFLPPRMNISEIANIQNPANGLKVYNTTDEHLYVFTTTDNVWKRLAYDAPTIVPFVCGNAFPDYRDGKSYQTIQVGLQCWMKENLNVGTRINITVTQSNNGTIEKYCYSDNDANCATYGGLYQWDELMNYTTSSAANPSGRTGICPEGWHLPSDAEWCQLEIYLDATVNCSTGGGRGTDAGGKMKETGTSHWNSPNTGATNSSGLTWFAGGLANAGSFSNLNKYAYIWTSTQYSTSDGWNRRLWYNSQQTGLYYGDKSGGFSARCVKN